jgi:alpha-N-acetylglucosaminidase
VSAASDLLTYNARDQVTLWGPKREISDYASKERSGLVGGYYAKRWEIWIDAYKSNGARAVRQAALHQKIVDSKEGWVRKGLTGLENVPNSEKIEKRGLK